MRQGEELFLAVQNHRNRVSVKRGSKAQVNQKASGTETVVRTAYSSLATVVRALFVSDPAARAALGLAGRAPDSRAAFVATAENLFTACLGAAPALKATLARYGYTEAKLLSEQAKIAAQETAKAKAQSLTPQQRAALDTLTAEVNKLRKYARRALSAKPQLLEAIGVKG